MKPVCTIGIVALAIGAIYFTPERPANSEPRAATSSAKLTALLKERRDTLKQLVKIVEARYRNGAATEESVIQASLQLQQAELDLAKTRRERIAICKRTVELLRKQEKIAQARFEAARGTREDVLSARAARLQAEIQMLREQSSK